MRGHKQFLSALLLTILPGAMVAQNNTNSPYTRYGYGQLSDQTFGASKAMGGIAYGLRDKSHINPLNPASYTAVDSLTFLFEGGITLQNTNFSDGTTKLNAKNSSLDYLAMQFRLHKRLAMTVGLLPFSNTGYSLGQVNTEDPNAINVITYSGEGGLHQVFGGLGFKIMENLSVGANASYLWGDVTKRISVTFPYNTSASSYQKVENLSVSDIKLDLGLQYTRNIDAKNALIAGAVFSPKRELNNNAYTQTIASYNTTKDTIVSCGIPLNVGLGLTYIYDKRLKVGVDYTLQKWSKVSYMNDANAFCDYSKIAVGAEFLPGYTGRSYFSHIKYRLGAYYSEPYHKIKGVRAAEEYGITGGIVLPLPRSRSGLSISTQYVTINGRGDNMLNEKYIRLNIGLTFNERWFLKWKVD